MLEYDRIDISEGKQMHQKSVKFVIIWYLQDIGFKYEPYLCNVCHGLMQNAISFNDVAVVYIKGSAYRIHICYMSKNDGISIMKNSKLIDRMGVL